MSTFQSKEETVFLNFGRDYPNQDFTVVIFPDNAKQFKYNIADSLLEKKICVVGHIEEYKGKPQIVVSTPEQIRTQ